MPKPCKHVPTSGKHHRSSPKACTKRTHLIQSVGQVKSRAHQGESYVDQLEPRLLFKINYSKACISVIQASIATVLQLLSNHSTIKHRTRTRLSYLGCYRHHFNLKASKGNRMSYLDAQEDQQILINNPQQR